MSLDAIAIAAVADELRRTVLGGRAQKVVQADELTFGLELYAQRQRRWLLLSADPERARVHLAGEKLGRAGELVSPLLLLLRKHLRRARLLRVEQPGLERILSLTFGPSRLPPAEEEDEDDGDVGPELSPGSGADVTLIIEAIGRYSNLVLVDAEGVILDSAKRVTAEINRYRVVLPRRPYVPPPPQDKLSPFDLSSADLQARLAAAPPKTAAWQVLVTGYAGISPQLAREAVHRAAGRASLLAGEVPDVPAIVLRLRELLAPIRNGVWERNGAWEPSFALSCGGCASATEGERVVAFAPYLLTQYPEVRRTESISAAIETYYSQVARFRPVDQAREAAQRALAPRRGAAARKLESLERALEGGHKADRLRRCGEAILSHVADLPRGQTLLVSDGLEVELDPSLTPVENAQAYFKRYRKAKAALEGVPFLIEETQHQLDYLDQAAAYLALAENVDQVRAIQRELSERAPAKPGRSGAGKVRAGQRKQKGKENRDRGALGGIGRYTSGDGLEILVGRTGRQNDAVTFEHAGPDDVWLHARGVPGAHVVVRSGGGPVPERTIRDAAQLAAAFSASRGATTVPVDWTRRRLVRRVRDRYPGLVTYTGERTIHVSPEIPPDVQKHSS